MNKNTKILFAVLFAAVVVAACNVIARLNGDEAAALTPREEARSEAGLAVAGEDLSVTGEGLTVKSENLLEIPAAPKGASAISLRRTAYSLLYDKTLRLPLWVGWHLTAEHTEGGYMRKGLKFAEDEEVPLPRATNADYANSGYDRGHMCPSGDNKWSEQAQLESFLYTNCCPQLHSLNAGDWEELEARCRKWAKAYGDIYIACGPVLLNKRHKTIGRNKVVVPEAFYKVVLCMQGTPKAIGFIYRNEKADNKMASYVNSVDEVERITGMDFFAALPDDIEAAVEAHADLSEWE